MSKDEFILKVQEYASEKYLSDLTARGVEKGFGEMRSRIMAERTALDMIRYLLESLEV